MSLKLPPPPSGTQAVVASAVKRAHSSSHLFRLGISGGATAVTPVAPHQVYNIGLDQVSIRTGLAAAKLVGWRVIVVEGKNPVAAVEFSKDEAAAPAVFKSYNQGSYVQSTASAIAMAEGIPRVKAKDFEPRLLQIPSIYLLALWLHGQKEDLLIPLGPAPSEFKPYTIYSKGGFFKLAAALAKRRAAFDDRPKDGQPKQGRLIEFEVLRENETKPAEPPKGTLPSGEGPVPAG